VSICNNHRGGPNVAEAFWRYTYFYTQSPSFAEIFDVGSGSLASIGIASIGIASCYFWRI